MENADWGGDDRYYSHAKPGGSDSKRSKWLTGEWERILKSLDSGIEKRIRGTCSQWNLTIRESLRNETALRLSHGDQQVSIPVKVVGGIPDPLIGPLEELLGIAPLLLRRQMIRKSIDGVKFVHDERDLVVEFLDKRGEFGQGSATAGDMKRVLDLLSVLSLELDKVEALKTVWGLRIDCLGAYFFRRPEVEIYWLAIAIVGLMANIDIEALTIVTLSHELAHAYTHLGRDIDGNQWETNEFAHCDLHIVEGLAQHYTKAVCTKLMFRHPASLNAFNALLKNQSPPYTCFTDWTKDKEDPGEHIRRCMLAVRKQSIVDYEVFRKGTLGLTT